MPALLPTPPDPRYETRVRESFARQRVMAFLGAELGVVRPGYCEIALTYRPELAQQHGYFHAGIIATVADSAGGYAGFTLMPADSSVLSIEYKINLLAPGAGERLLTRGTVLRSGRSITVCQVEALVSKDGEETLCAVLLQTLKCLRGRPDV